MPKKLENNKTSIFLYSSIAAVAGFLVIAMMSVWYGVKMYNNRLLEAAEQNGKAVQASLFLAFLMVVYVALAVVQLKVQKKGLAVFYGIMLAFTFLAFFCLSGGLFYASKGVVRDTLYKECANATSDIHKADALYLAGNA